MKIYHNLKKSQLFLFSILLGISVCIGSESDIIQLTDTNFDTYISEGIWLIEVYAPWCSHCRKIKPIVEEVATQLKSLGIRVGAIDGSKETVLMARFYVSGFPSFYHLAKGECRDYEGERTVSDFVDFATNGWKKKDPWPFYRAPNSPVGHAISIITTFPTQIYNVYHFLHFTKGYSELSILALFLSIPVSIGLAFICTLDYFHSRQYYLTRHHQHQD